MTEDLADTLKEADTVDPNIYQVPINISVVGSTGTGKTFRTKQILRDYILPQVDYFIIMCPTLELTGDYDEFVENHDPESPLLKVFKFTTDFENITAEIIESQNELLLNKKRSEVPQIVLLYDDCLGSKMLGNFGMLSNFSARSRHLNISMIFLSQRISGISRTIRLNSGVFILFSNFNHSENESWVAQYVPKKYKAKVLDKINQLFNVKYQFLVANNREPKVMKRLLINGVKPINFESLN